MLDEIGWGKTSQTTLNKTVTGIFHFQWGSGGRYLGRPRAWRRENNGEKQVPRDGRVGRPEGKMAKKKLPRAENFRSKGSLCSNWSGFLYSAVISLGDLVFSGSVLCTTVSVSVPWGTKGEVICPCLGQSGVGRVKKSWKILTVRRLLW